MAEHPQFLSKEDVKILQGLIDREKRRTTNDPPTRITDRWDQGEDHQAPETYIAAIPVAGIPGKDAVDDYGAYPYAEYQEDLAGSAECNIYQIVKEGSLWKLRDAGFSKVVYNFADSAISGPGFVPITRDKFGKWLALSTSAGGSETVQFEITEYCPDLPSGTSQCVYATILRTSCGTTSVAAGDEILVCDPDMCWLNLPVELLVGLRGTAISMRSTELTLVCADFPLVGSCIWIVQFLCCAEETYAYGA